MHSQYVWNKSALVWHVTTEARKWGDHLPEVPAGHLSGNPRDPNIPLLLILRYILFVVYISLFFCLSVLVILGTQTFLCFWCVSFVVLFICISFDWKCQQESCGPKYSLAPPCSLYTTIIKSTNMVCANKVWDLLQPKGCISFEWCWHKKFYLS